MSNTSSEGIHPVWHHLLQPEVSTITMDRGEGIYLYDVDGNRYIDGISAMGACMVGHGRVELAEAAARQMERLAFVGLTLGYSHEPALRVAQEVLHLTNMAGGAVWFHNSGSEAVEAALRIALQYHLNRGDSQRQLVLTCEQAYNGITLGAAAVTGDPGLAPFWGEMASRFVRLPPTPDTEEGSRTFVAALQAAINIHGDRIAALIAEPIPTPGWTRVPPSGHWQEVSNILNDHGILYVCDEVFMGFGRTGSMFGHQRYGVVPDLIIMAKGLTSGYAPLSACVVSPDVVEGFEATGDKALRFGGTYSGHPVSCAVALTNLRILEEESLVDNAAARGKQLAAGLSEVVADQTLLHGPYGVGLIQSLRIDGEQPEQIGHTLRTEARSRGLIIGYRGGATINLYPPLVIREGQVDELLAIFSSALEST